MTTTTAAAGVTRAKPPRAGGEIDAYCTKCRMDLNHRIVAMVGDDVKRVKCLTCDGEHNYRRPMAEREKEKERKALAKEAHGATSTRSRASGPRTERGGASKLNAKQLWERSIAGQPPTAFKAYNVKSTFSAGELLRHARFGDGVVARVIDAQKVEVLFEDGPKTMAQAMVS